MPPATSFKDLIVWQKAHGFVLGVYELTGRFPKQEVFGLTAQLRRAAVSIPANIAEGFTRKSSAEKARYLNIAQGSLDECRYYLILAKDLNYGETGALQQHADEVGRILHSCYAGMHGKSRVTEMPIRLLRQV